MLSRILSQPVNGTPSRHALMLSRMAAGFAILLSGFAVGAEHLVRLVSGAS
jgi:hypothetical protein